MELSFWDPSWNHHVLMFGCLCDARMPLWPSYALTDFAWEVLNYFSFLLKAIFFFPLLKSSSHLSSFLTSGWVWEDKMSPQETWQHSKGRANNCQYSLLEYPENRVRGVGVFWKGARKDWRSGQSANLYLLFSWLLNVDTFSVYISFKKHGMHFNTLKNLPE